MRMTATFKDYYQILNVDRKATNKEIKAAYHTAARKYHPDMHIKSEKAAAEEKFKEINEAYEVLGDPEKRSKYDLIGKETTSVQESQASPNVAGQERDTWSQADTGGFSDFFESLYGRKEPNGFTGRYGQPKGMQGDDLESEISLRLEEAYHGGQKTLRLSSKGICPVCGGTGTVSQRICQSCGGRGYKNNVKTLDVKIPAGIKEGNKIRLKGQGGEGTGGGECGDLMLTIKILPHALFTLKGNNVESTIRIRPEQGVLGSQMLALTLNGKVMITVPPMSHNGDKLRLRSKGWPRKDGAHGDQYVKISIDIPNSLSQAEREIYQRLAELRKSDS